MNEITNNNIDKFIDLLYRHRYITYTVIGVGEIILLLFLMYISK